METTETPEGWATPERERGAQLMELPDDRFDEYEDDRPLALVA